MNKMIRILYLQIFFIATLLNAQVEWIDWNSIRDRTEKGKDTVYVINFWSTWCKPCLEELPYLFEETEKLSSEKISFIPVSLDFPEDHDTKLVPWVKKKFSGKKFYQFRSFPESEIINAIHPEWSGAIPFTLIVFREKNKYLAYEKKFKPGELRKILQDILKQ